MGFLSDIFGFENRRLEKETLENEQIKKRYDAEIARRESNKRIEASRNTPRTTSSLEFENRMRGYDNNNSSAAINSMNIQNIRNSDFVSESVSYNSSHHSTPSCSSHHSSNSDHSSNYSSSSYDSGSSDSGSSSCGSD